MPGISFRSRRRALIGAWMLAPTIGGCSLGPNYHRPDTDIPPAFRATPASAETAWPKPDWWQGFNSPPLTTLEEQARARNFDIAAAVARVRQADAQARISGAALLPTVTGSGTATWNESGNSRTFSSSSLSGLNTTTIVTTGRGRRNGFDTRLYSGGATASYQLDFWGRNQALSDAAVASAVFSRFDQQVVALTVSANVANAWFTALAFEDRLKIAQNNLRDSEQTLRVIQTRLEVGTATALDVAQEAALVAGVRASIPNLRNQAEQQIIGLGILTGVPPQSVVLPPGTLDDLALPVVQPGLPSELLARRPDVAEAEAQLVSANASIRAARAAFFPSITLTSSFGYQSAALGSLIGPGSLLLSAAAQLSQPIFDGGTLRGQLEQTKGRQDELVADYRKAIVQAFTDVEDALTAWRYTTEQEALERVAVRTAQQAADIARAQLAAGTVDITTVLTAQTTLYNDEDILAQVRLTRFQALLNLYKALGGGWTQPGGPILKDFPGLSPGRIGGSLALPVGGNIE